jgi:tetratricopeptide (TPR) repeat protein
MKFKNIKQARRKSAPTAIKPKQKKVGDSGKTLQFPNIYRRITERLSFSLSWQAKLDKKPGTLLTLASILFSMVLIVGIVIFGLKIYQNFSLALALNMQRQNLQSEINFWQSVTAKFDGYKDAYFQKALLEYNLGQIQQAKLDNLKALQLDPNFEDARKLEVVLDKAH